MAGGRKRKSSIAEAAVEDFKRQKEAHEKRRQVIAGSDLPLTPERRVREFAWREASLDVLCKPARFAVSFKDLPTTAKQVRILGEAARDARAILYDLERSQQRKRLDISYMMRDAARRIKDVEAQLEAKLLALPQRPSSHRGRKREGP